MKWMRIRDAALRRGITALFHFTPIANLESILVNGLVSRDILDGNQATYTYTDPWRLDGRSDAVSLSIHGINERMFFEKRRQAPHCGWVIFEIDPSVLWTHECRFCWVNASSKDITARKGYIGGPWAFERMFEDIPVGFRDNRSWRALNNMPDHMPTRNDAEVQVRQPIAPDLLRSLTVESDRVRLFAEAVMKDIERILPIDIEPNMAA